jgi:hypothetical protein
MAKGIKTGGRAKGVPNKVTADIKALAQSFGAEAITSLIEIARNSENDQARIAASRELLDRGYGKPLQGVEVSGPNGGPLQVVRLRNTPVEELPDE